MTCQNCHEHESTVVITKIVGEQHTITHLCKTCANELGGAGGVAISIQMLTSGSEPTDECGTCGKTFAEFKKSGLFGCADCYGHFEAHLPKLFKRVQGVTEHVFDVEKPPEQDDLASLEEALSDAVACEDFERAAFIRDQLAELRRGNAPAS
ncbi:MAG: hypothetical protein CME19_19180 [Gemmatimonadetes bacterium]|nr:hypothetical protein [Gemmatimonadota bacterium]|tara:strand:+ start:702 stop:1157 length:456 start_codon:yes stop_codon:yes gene_type:complete